MKKDKKGNLQRSIEDDTKIDGIYRTWFDAYKTLPDIEKKEISKETYYKVISTFFHLLSRICIETGMIFSLPSLLGKLGVRRLKAKNESFEIAGKKYDYIDTYGYYAKFHWSKKAPYMNDPYMVIFKFVNSRANKAYMRDCIVHKNTILKYYEFS